jgi:hypothetical protein
MNILTILVILYVGLILLDTYYDFHWKEYVCACCVICILISILLFMEHRIMGGTIWFVVFLLEYKRILNEF